MNQDRFWLTDAQFSKIEPHLPTDTRGKARVDDRRVISGIVHVLKSGGRWIDAPSEYGPKKTLYNRYVRWAEKGVWIDPNRNGAAVACIGGQSKARLGGRGAQRPARLTTERGRARQLGRPPGGKTARVLQGFDRATPRRKAPRSDGLGLAAHRLSVPAVVILSRIVEQE
jgi:transposase